VEGGRRQDRTMGLNEGAQREAVREMVRNLLMSKSESKPPVGSLPKFPRGTRKRPCRTVIFQTFHFAVKSLPGQSNDSAVRSAPRLGTDRIAAEQG
jgi:hypothetical protein